MMFINNIYECHGEPSQHCLPKNCATILLSNLQGNMSSGVSSRGLQVEKSPMTLFHWVFYATHDEGWASLCWKILL